MQRQIYEFVEVSDERYDLPMTLKQSNPRLSRIPGLVLMSTLAACVVGPQIGLAACGFASAEVRESLIAHPAIALELALALTFWIALVCWPLQNLLMAVLSQRHVDIRDGAVTVVDETPFAARRWQLPLATYEGIALHVRSSLSGTRQEAVLVHPNRNRSVILMVAERIGERELDALCRALDLPRVPASRIYGFGRPFGGRPAAGGLEPVAA